MPTFSKDQGYQAFRLLQVVFIAIPILAGLDKFFYLLTNWSRYLSPMAMQMIQGQDLTFFMGVGVIEIFVGIGMIFKPKIFSYVVAAWLLLIIANLLLGGRFLDIALRDAGLMLGAIALARLSSKYAD